MKAGQMAPTHTLQLVQLRGTELELLRRGRLVQVERRPAQHKAPGGKGRVAQLVGVGNNVPGPGLVPLLRPAVAGRGGVPGHAGVQGGDGVLRMGNEAC